MIFFFLLRRLWDAVVGWAKRGARWVGAYQSLASLARFGGAAFVIDILKALVCFAAEEA